MIRSVVIGDGGPASELLTRALGGVPAVELVAELVWRRFSRSAIEDAQPDLIFIDEPSWSPLPLAVIREARCAAPGAVVVVRAADATAQWLADALLAGASAVLPAVVDATTLGIVIQEALDVRQADPEAVGLGWAA